MPNIAREARVVRVKFFPRPIDGDRLVKAAEITEATAFPEEGVSGVFSEPRFGLSEEARLLGGEGVGFGGERGRRE